VEPPGTHLDVQEAHLGTAWLRTSPLVRGNQAQHAEETACQRGRGGAASFIVNSCDFGMLPERGTEKGSFFSVSENPRGVTRRNSSVPQGLSHAACAGMPLQVSRGFFVCGCSSPACTARSRKMSRKIFGRLKTRRLAVASAKCLWIAVKK